MAIGGVLYPILQFMAFHRKQPLDRICAGWHVAFQPVWYQNDLLSNFEFVNCHVDPLHIRCHFPVIAEATCLSAGTLCSDRRAIPATARYGPNRSLSCRE